MDIVEKLFEQTADNIAGSCFTFSMEQKLAETAEFYNLDVEVTDTLVREFEAYLEHIDQRVCGNCGWWNYPGDYCDCEFDGEYDDDF